MSLLLLLVLSLPALVVGDNRHLVLNGNPMQRGMELARARNSSIKKLFELKMSMYSKLPGALDRWLVLANEAAPFIQKYAPVTWGELQGAASAGVKGMDMRVMLLLAVEYDLYVEVSANSTKEGSHLMFPADKCSGFGAAGLSGQNNDEDPSIFSNASEDLVLSIKGDTPGDSALIYTHPGWPAYMGINSHGLSVLWQYIDTGERGKGLPTVVIIRELLAQSSLEDALDFLERVPRTIPNNFILTDSKRTVNVEVSPSHFSPLSISHGFVVHTNHLLFDQAMQDTDIGPQQAATTFARYHAFRKMVKAQGSAGVDADDLRRMLLTAPLYRDGTHGTDNLTLASMVFNSSARSLSIWFKGDPHGARHTYSLLSESHHLDGATIV